MTRAAHLLLIATLAMGASTPSLAFEDTYVRYLGRNDILRVFNDKFPNARHGVTDRTFFAQIPIYEIDRDCVELTGAFSNSRFYRKGIPNIELLGVPDPKNGEAISRTPSAAFARWIKKCAAQHVQSDIEQSMKAGKSLEHYFGEEGAEQFYRLRNLEWSDVTPELQRWLIRALIVRFIGPGIVENEKSVVDALRTASSRYAKKGVPEAIGQIVVMICLREEFLRY